MNNEETKKKVVEILFPVLKGSRVSCNEENACERCWFPCEVDRIADSLSDALIAAGFGDVKEAEHRAEVAERALKSRAMCHMLKYFPNEISGLESCSQEVYEAWIYQAEKELAEEGEDGEI